RAQRRHVSAPAPRELGPVRSALLAIHGALQLALVHARAPAHAEAARLLVELFAGAAARALPARAKAAAPPGGDVAGRGTRAGAGLQPRPSGVESRSSSTSATDSNTEHAPASTSSSREKPPVMTATVSTCARRAACTSQGVSPTIVACDAGVPARSSAAFTRSGAGLVA